MCRQIVDKIDRDYDGKISREELKAWIQYTQRRYINEDVDRQWNAHNPHNKNTITWEEYKKMVYGFMDDMEPSELEKDDEGFSYKDMIRRDQRRWSIADTNGDHGLDKVNLISYVFPFDFSIIGYSIALNRKSLLISCTPKMLLTWKKLWWLKP